MTVISNFSDTQVLRVHIAAVVDSHQIHKHLTQLVYILYFIIQYLK